MPIENVESQWSRELRSDVEIRPTSMGEFNLYLDGSFELKGNLPSIEDFLNRLAMHTTLDDMRDGF